MTARKRLTAAEHRQSAARKQASARARKRALGLKPMEVWAFPDDHAAIRAYARQLVDGVMTILRARAHEEEYQ